MIQIIRGILCIAIGAGCASVGIKSLLSGVKEVKGKKEDTVIDVTATESK